MDYMRLPRDADKVYSQFVEQDDGSMIVKDTTKVVFPRRFLERDMAYIGDDVRSVGIFMIVSGGARCVFSVAAMVTMQPDSIEYITEQGIDYAVLTFDKGSHLFKGLDVVQQDILVYRIYKEILSSGNVPFYMELNDKNDDPAAVLDTAKEYAGTNIGSQRAVTELISSLSARNPENLVEYFRQLPPEVQAKTRPNFIGLISAAYGATTTLSRLAGSYFDQGMVAAMVYPTQEISRQERLVRE